MIQVFSKRTDKPHAYPFLKPAQIDNQSIKKYADFNPIEFAISQDGKSWTSCYDVPTMQGVYCYASPTVPTAKRTDTLKKVGLQDGSRLLSSTYDQRSFKMSLHYRGVDSTDAQLALEAAQRFLVGREAYWISFADWLGRMYYVTATMADPVYASQSVWSCDVNFTDIIGLSRSMGTSLNYPDDVWGVNSNLPAGVDPQYTFTTNSFSVYNLSDVMIDPERRGHPFVMTLQGSSKGSMKVTNKTTNTEIARLGNDKTKGSSFNGSFVLNGINPTLNGQGDFLNTDGGVITLDIGKNDFQVDNFQGKIIFDFPFWWLA